ncbi:MAG: glycosyltransferase family 9 protein [Deltaproteobacteria bacterium]|jgi:ADP-heptose:LPS heptosyltransferase|nr:glycosyltransferase family 9 protein [Deltaproteobacteria bacterium]
MRDLPRNWLVFRLSALGDVILTTGPLRFWNENAGWRFHVLTRVPFAPVFDHNPAVDAVLAAGPEDLRLPRMGTWFATLAARYAGWGLLDLHGSVRSRLLALAWKGPVLRYAKHALARRAFLASGGRLCRALLGAANVPQRYALAALTAEAAPPPSELRPSLYMTREERDFGKSFLAKLFGDDVLKSAPGRMGPVAVHPYAAHPHKAWPEGHCRELLAALEARSIPWFLLGRGDAVFPGDARDASNRTTLRESAAIIGACSALVSGDSGPLHLATAVGTPVVGLFGPTTREWGFFPSGPRDRVLERDMDCRPCSLHGKNVCPHEGRCLARIRPEEVLTALESIREDGDGALLPWDEPDAAGGQKAH